MAEPMKVIPTEIWCKECGNWQALKMAEEFLRMGEGPIMCEVCGIVIGKVR